ncbi:MAG: Gfo/Idh/MocA family oxidoreductase [Caldilineaceae bacterium]
MTLKLAFIGCGGIARRHVVAMKDLSNRGRTGFTITAVCDTHEPNAQLLAKNLAEQLDMHPTVYTDYQELLRKEQLDGVDICLPHGLHHGVAIDCMEAGLHVLCEKPLGVTIKACRAMAETADRTGKMLSTAVPHRRQPGQRTAHWIFNEAKLIGEPLTFFHHYTRPPVRQTSNDPLPPAVVWRRDRLMSGGGPALDSGFHYCDSLRYFFGDIERIYAELRELKTGQPRGPQEAPEDTMFVTFTFKSGIVGNWSLSLAAPGQQHYNVTFYGSSGSLQDTTAGRFSIFHLFERRPEQRESGRLLAEDGKAYSMEELNQLHLDALSAEQREMLYPGGTDDGFAIEIWEFIELLQGKRAKPEVDGWEGLRSLAIGEAIYESAITGEAIRVDDIISGKRAQFQAPIDAHWKL